MSMMRIPFWHFVWSGWTATWPTQLLALIWIAWLISWAVGSFFSARTEKHVRTWDSRAYRIPILVGAVLLTPWTAQVLGEQPLWKLSNGAIYVLAGLTLAGTLFTWWARIHLGRFWSNAITRKEGHRVIDTGPYGLVRHPIYTGLIAAMFATGIGVGTVTAMLGAMLISRRPLAEGPHGRRLFDQRAWCGRIRSILQARSDVGALPAATLNLVLHPSFLTLSHSP